MTHTEKEKLLKRLRSILRQDLPLDALLKTVAMHCLVQSNVARQSGNDPAASRLMSYYWQLTNLINH